MNTASEKKIGLGSSTAPYPPLYRIFAIPLYLLVALLPLEHVQVIVTSATRLGVVGVLLTTLVLLTLRFGVPAAPRHRRTIALYALLPVLLGSIIVASALVNWTPLDQEVGWRAVFSGMTQPLLALSVFVILHYNPDAVTPVAWIFIAGGVTLGVVNIGQATGILPEMVAPAAVRPGIQFLPLPRYSPIPIFGTYGVLSSIAFGLILGRLQARSRRNVLPMSMLAVAASIIFVGVMITQSRSTYLAIAGVMTAYVLFMRRRLARYLVGGFLVGVGVFALVPLVDLLIEVNPRTVLNRLTTFRLAIDAFLDSPIFGTGWDIRAITNEQDRVVHNTFLALLGYLGIAGFLAHMACYGGVLWLARKGYQESGAEAWIHLGLFLGTVGWFVENMFYLGIRGYAIWILLGVALHLRSSGGVSTRGRKEPITALRTRRSDTGPVVATS